MRAVDTNVLARYVVQDDPVQSPAATEILAQLCFVSDTVLLEFAWLMSSRYGVDRAELAATMRDLVRLPSLHVNDEATLIWAIDQFATGADFADMLHIAAARHADCFASFEKQLAKQAGATPPVPIERLA